MAYDLHVIRTAHWLDASKDPIRNDEIDHLVASDPELGWSKQDFVEMKDESGETTRYYMINWNGVPCF